MRLIYELGAISKKALKKGLIKLSQTSIELPTSVAKVLEARIIPKCGQYVIEIGYNKEVTPEELNPDLVAGIDIGLDNLAALTSNKLGFWEADLRGLGTNLLMGSSSMQILMPASIL